MLDAQGHLFRGCYGGGGGVMLDGQDAGALWNYWLKFMFHRNLVFQIYVLSLLVLRYGQIWSYVRYRVYKGVHIR